MTRRIIAIIFIFFCATVAWAILGATIFARTSSTDERLGSRVASNWGTPQEQMAPTASYQRAVVRKSAAAASNTTAAAATPEFETVPLPLMQSRVGVTLKLEHRQKGLLWYATYTVGFQGTYVFQNDSAQDVVSILFPFPARQAVYDDLVVTIDGVPVKPVSGPSGLVTMVRVKPGAQTTLGVRYRSQGLSSWRYTFGDNVSQVRDTELRVKTDFTDIDFAENTLSPTAKHRTPSGWDLEWRYTNMISGYPIGIVLPEHIQPGPLAGRIAFFAPVSLFFFFFLMFVITTIRNIELHPMNYVFLAAGFFAFHLLLAYLVDHIDVHLAFVIASLVSVALVVSYLRLVVNARFAMREAALAQFLFLVLFSYAFFFEGFTGLTITIGSVITLFVVMQMTGRVRWAEKFATKP